jgi:hypothetical protein
MDMNSLVQTKRPLVQCKTDLFEAAEKLLIRPHINDDEYKNKLKEQRWFNRLIKEYSDLLKSNEIWSEIVSRGSLHKT